MPTLSLPIYEAVAITDNERAFFAALGGRIARLRKQQDITQVQLAELLGITQQTLNSYETGRRRVPVSLLPALAKRLGVAVEAILDDDTKAAAKRGPVSKLQQQLERISQLPKARQRVVSEVLDSLLAQSGR